MKLLKQNKLFLTLIIMCVLFLAGTMTAFAAAEGTTVNAPESVTVIAKKVHSFEITFAAAFDSNGDAVDGYYVYRSTTAEDKGSNLTPDGVTVGNGLTDTDGKLNYTDSTAKAGVAYYYTVESYSNIEGGAQVTAGSGAVKAADPGYATLAAPQLVSAKASGTTKAIVTWKAVADADSYVLYRKGSSGSWTTLKTGITGTSYTDTTAKRGTTYYYTVRAAVSDSSYQSEYQKAGIKVTIPMVVPTMKKVVVKDKWHFTLTWSKVSGATGYDVYVKAPGSSSYKKIASPKSTTYTYGVCKSSSLAYKYWGKKYAFKVVSKTADTTSAFSNGISCVLKANAVTFKNAASVDYNSNKVTWTKLSGANGYYILRKVKGGSWKKIGTVSSGSTVTYTDNKAVLGTKYYYTVRAYWKSGSTITGGLYNKTGKSVTTKLSAPKLKSASSGSTSITVKWKKTAGAQGYYIYRKVEGKGSWKKLTKIKSGSTTSFVDKTATGTSKYSYTVQAYRKSGSKTYKSSYNTTGKSTKLAISIKYKKVTDKSSPFYGKTLKLYYNSKGKQIQDVTDIISQKSGYMLYVNRYKNYVTVYVKDGKYYVPVKTLICSCGGSNTPLGTYYTKGNYRWHELMGPCWGQWCTRITGDGVLFHSVFYNSLNNNNNLAVSAYNRLGTTASHGCVRLTAGDAKWIYDNCPGVGTKVVIYSNSGYEPLAKPTAYKLSASHTWDPTDPNMQYKCKKYGCHDVD